MKKKSYGLKWKVVVGITMTSTVSVLLAVLIFASIEMGRLRQTIVSESETIAKIIGVNLVGALSFGDTDSGLETLAALKANSHIHDVVIYDDAGEAFIWYHWSGTGEEPASMGTFDDIPVRLAGIIPTVGINMMDNDFSITQEISSEGSNVGTIYLLNDIELLNDTIDTFIFVTFLISIGVGLFSFTLSMLIQRNIIKPINDVAFALRDMAEGEGDLTRRLRVSANDELGQLVTWFNTFVQKIQKVVIQFRATANDLSTAATELNSQSSITNQSILEQQREIEQLLKAMDEMSTIVQDVSDSVVDCANDAQQADTESKLGREVVGETMRAIEDLASDIEAASDVIARLQQDSDSIGTVLDVIRGIAEQTNLLALNAAIEAARAGEQGRGFAVVADEVRTLASRTQVSTQEIHDMIDSLQAGSREAVLVMDKGRRQAHSSVASADKAKTSLEAITKAVSTIKNVSKQIAEASSGQRVMTQDINGNIVNISEAVRKTSEGSREMAARAQDLDQLSNDMLALVRQFKV